MCVSFPCSVAAVRMADGLTFVIYEFWETEEEWKRLVQRCLYPMTWGWGYGKMELAGSRLLSREERVGRMVKSLTSGCRGFSIQASFLSWRACAFHPEAAGFLVGQPDPESSYGTMHGNLCSKATPAAVRCWVLEPCYQ